MHSSLVNGLIGKKSIVVSINQLRSAAELVSIYIEHKGLMWSRTLAQIYSSSIQHWIEIYRLHQASNYMVQNFVMNLKVCLFENLCDLFRVLKYKHIFQKYFIF